MLEINTIGAGGGSIGRIDAGGLMRVGPQSAGADPGPACYGLGGDKPTTTDANLVLGYLDPGDFAGGSMKLDVEAARRAIETHIAEPLGLSVEEAAAGMYRVGKGMGCMFGDFDLDGDQDLVVANDRFANYFYVNDGWLPSRSRRGIPTCRARTVPPRLPDA